jgi:hypothetical protein
MNAVVQERGALVNPATTPDRLIALAIEHGADVDRLGKLMDLQERWQAQESRRAFYEAMAAFQANCPPIPKSKEVKNRDGTPRYKYAPLDAIIKLLREPLKACGFSWRFDSEHVEDVLKVTCILTHSAGHSESATVDIPAVTGHGTNAAQDEGSGMTYGKRYAFANVTGVTIDEDNDGETAGPRTSMVLLRQMVTLSRLEILDGVLRVKRAHDEKDTDAAAEVLAEWTRPEFGSLWIAPTKGGIWTVEERRWLKDDAELKDKIHILRQDAGWYDQAENQL